MGKASYLVDSVSDNALAIAGSANTINQDKSVQMQDDAKIVGGDSVESMGTLTKVSESGQIGGYRVGDNSSLLLTSLDNATKDLLLTAFETVGATSNNMMTLAAGRNPDSVLADTSVETTAAGVAAAKNNALLEFVKTTPGKIAVALTVVAVAAIFWRKKK